jgi:hypothetical protein
MAIPVGKLAPSAVALVFVADCVWPILSELTLAPRPTPPKKVPELAAALASPAMPPRPTRNPFEWTDAALLAAAKGSPKAARKTAAQTAALGTAKTPDKPVDPLGALKLDATSILGDRRLAVINGQLYALHDRLAGDSSTPPYRIVGVLPCKVLLEREGKTVELTYSDTASRSASSPRAGVRGKAVAAGAAPAANPRTASKVAKSGGNRQSSKAGK